VPKFTILLISGWILILLSCASTPPQPNLNYENGIRDWHQDRINRLKQPDSWLSLAGLFWLDEGENSFGSASDNDVVFPGEMTPEYLGSFQRQGDSIWVETVENEVITHNGLLITGRVLMTSDSEGEPAILALGTLSWYIIKRGEKYGVRLKDSKNHNLLSFTGIERYPVNESWLVNTILIPHPEPTTIPIPNVLGQINDSPSPGILVFTIAGTEYRLEPIASPEDKTYFIIFADETSGMETYGAGRFLVADAADEDGMTILDFNKAYNPPCAFSEFATCPLPPAQNVLSIKIEAGEKAYHAY